MLIIIILVKKKSLLFILCAKNSNCRSVFHAPLSGQIHSRNYVKKIFVNKINDCNLNNVPTHLLFNLILKGGVHGTTTPLVGFCCKLTLVFLGLKLKHFDLRSKDYPYFNLCNFICNDCQKAAKKA